MYNIAKQLNSIISQYIPSKYPINSTDDFLQIINLTNPTGFIASLDVESLFTNVPVHTTIEIICNYIYSHKTIPTPNILKTELSQLLTACITQCPFAHIDGSLYLQTDGVAMGSPLVVTFANFYMSHLENNILDNNPTVKSTTYCRYVDDIFVITKDPESLLVLKTEFERNSVVKFTHEPNINNKINFLDVHVDATNHHILCSTFTKPTSSGVLLNYQGKCPQRYKDATILSWQHCHDVFL